MNTPKGDSSVCSSLLSAHRGEAVTEWNLKGTPRAGMTRTRTAEAAAEAISHRFELYPTAETDSSCDEDEMSMTGTRAWASRYLDLAEDQSVVTNELGENDGYAADDDDTKYRYKQPSALREMQSLRHFMGRKKKDSCGKEASKGPQSSRFVESVIGALASCGPISSSAYAAGGNLSISISALAERLPRVQSATASKNFSCGRGSPENESADVHADEEYEEDDTYQIYSLDTAAEEEAQMRRLASWSTVGTVQTLPSMKIENVDSAAELDENKNPETQDFNSKKASKKRVTFDYPPVSSLKQCPRADPLYMRDLFFTEEELNVYESDRRATYVADDIEIVALVKSPAHKTVINKVMSASEKEPGSKVVEGLGNYINASRRRIARKQPWGQLSTANGKEKGTDQSSEGMDVRLQRRQSMSRLGRRHRSFPRLWGTTSSGSTTDASSSVESPVGRKCNDNRLIESVQIYLRDRSSGDR